MKIGIDAIGVSFPSLYLPIEILAKHRNIEVDKLKKGLGLERISLLDANEDPISQAANAVLNLIENESINLSDVSKIYVATESSLDNSKPIGSYIVSLIEQQLGARKLQNCDTVDFTFACIGGVDALLNCMDYIRLHPTEHAIVVTTDKAKYDLNSTGEYTQGAGAVALLIKENPSIIALEPTVGIATEGVFDFFKPYHTFSKSDFQTNTSFFEDLNVLEQEISLHKEQPVFDGQYSNECYINRISEAYRHFCSKQNTSKQPYEDWHQIWMHLPYAFQGRRTFISIYAENNPDLLAQQDGENDKEKFKNLAKSTSYLKLVHDKIKPSEYVSGMIGNIYTGSIFLGMIGSLTQLLSDKNENLVDKKMGFIAYGSGSKSKVFEGIMQENWQHAIEKIQLIKKINLASPVDFETYEKLHKKQLSQPVNQNQKGFVLSHIEKEKPNLKGARYYRFVE